MSSMTQYNNNNNTVRSEVGSRTGRLSGDPDKKWVEELAPKPGDQNSYRMRRIDYKRVPDRCVLYSKYIAYV